MSCSSGTSLQTDLRKHQPAPSGSESLDVRNDSERKREEENWTRHKTHHKSKVGGVSRPVQAKQTLNCNRETWMEGDHEMKAYKMVIHNARLVGAQ